MKRQDFLMVGLSLRGGLANKTDRKQTAKLLAEAKAAKKTARVVKMVLPEEAMAPIKNFDESLREWFNDPNRTRPWMDVDGLRVTKPKLFAEIAAEVRRRQPERERLVDECCANWETWKLWAKARLNGLYNEADYPPVEKFRKTFSMELKCLPAEGDDWRLDLDPDEVAVIEATMAETQRSNETALRREHCLAMGAVLKKLAGTLADPEKVFRNSLVNNLADACRAVRDLNVASDPVVEQLVAEIEQGLDVSPGELREFPETRKAAADKAAEILKKMEAFYA